MVKNLKLIIALDMLGRRSGIERRRNQSSHYIVERRNGADRRNGIDRRCWLDRRCNSANIIRKDRLNHFDEKTISRFRDIKDQRNCEDRRNSIESKVGSVPQLNKIPF
jgi:hypothetical protein